VNRVPYTAAQKATIVLACAVVGALLGWVMVVTLGVWTVVAALVVMGVAACWGILWAAFGGMDE